MIIKHPSYKNRAVRFIREAFGSSSIQNRILLIIAGSLVTGVVLLAYLVVFIPARPKISQELEDSHVIAKHRFDPSISKAERIVIGISEKDYQKIVKQRNEALDRGVLIATANAYVPAKIRYGHQVYRAKLRLKGDWTDHLEGKKWSFRISMKDGETLFGMKEFSIQHPERRSFLHEWIFHEILKMEGILGLRLQWIDVTLNQKHLGLYTLEEHFDKLLIENNHYREGPILKFDEDLLWADRHRGADEEQLEGAYYASPIDLFQPNRILSNPMLKEQFHKAANLLERFRTGELSAPHVFDAEKLGRFYALCDLLGGHHALYYHNLRFYYNPLTARLEPIGFDADAGNVQRTLIYLNKFEDSAYYNFEKRIFEDDDFVAHYLQTLERVSHPEYLHDKWKDLQEDISKNVNILYEEFPNYFMTLKSYEFNQNVIRHALTPIKGLHAYLKGSAHNQLVLRVGNIQMFPLEILGIAYNDVMLFKSEPPVSLDGKDPRQPVIYKDVWLKQTNTIPLREEQKKDLKIIYRVKHTQQEQAAPVFSWDFYQDKMPEFDFVRKPSNVDQFDFIVQDEKTKTISIKPGNWTLTSSLIFPEGYVIVAQGGTVLDLQKGTQILSHSPLQWVGTEDRPISIISTDNSGQGLAVMKAGERSLLKYITFGNLAAISRTGWGLTGAVTFYEAPVDIRHCQFVGNRGGDDYLNIIRSDFSLADSQFSSTFADAVDIDYSKGEILRTQFTRTGNDAIDFSGSAVLIENVTITQALDKGISVGEGSEITAKDVVIRQSKLAVASKDSSYINIDGIVLEQCGLGFAAFQKKPEYGPATIEIRQLSMEGIGQQHMKQEGSTILIHH